MSDVLAFESAVAQLVNLGYERHVAEFAVRAQHPELAPVIANAERDARIREKEEQVEVRKLAIAFGFRVYVLSQPRATKQSPGIPDLWLAHLRLPVALWWETKRQVGGQLSSAQEEFRDECIRIGAGYGAGDRYAFAEKLIELGLAIRIDNRLEPARLYRPISAHGSHE